MDTTFGERLQRLRESSKSSQNELAKTLSVSVSTIRMLEKDERKPSFELLSKIAIHFNASADDLLFGETRLKSTTINDGELHQEFYEREDIIPSELFRTLAPSKLEELFLEKVYTISSANADMEFNKNFEKGNLTIKFLTKLIALGLVTPSSTISESIMHLLMTTLKIDVKTLTTLNDDYLNEKYRIDGLKFEE